MAKKEGTKLCKYCKTEIPADAKICPNCKKKQGGKMKWIIIAVVAIIIIGSIAGGGEPDSTGENGSNSQTKQSEEQQEKIEYTAYTVDEMMEDLNSNAMNAKNKYANQYLEITGKLSNIDSDGKYISLTPDDDYAIIGVHCSLKSGDETQKSKVAEMEIGSMVTLRGKCTDVGEVLGYYFDIESIEDIK